MPLNTSSEEAAPAAQPSLDAIDRRILAILQLDATIPVAELAARVGLSQTPCWRRVRRLEREGVISGRIAVLDPAKLGLGLSVLVFVQAPDHSPDWLATVARVIRSMPEVVEASRLAGDIDYFLHVVTSDTAAYDRFYARLIAAVPARSVTSRFVLEAVVARGPLPV